MDQIKQDYRGASLDDATRVVLDYADKLTRTPSAMVQADVDGLRAQGFEDRAIVDIAQVVAYFNYINRIADGLGVDPELEMPPRA